MTDSDKCILVVEDDKGMAEMFSEMLRVGGYKVLVCFNIDQAQEVLEDTRPDVIVLDMMMPVSSGMDLLKFVQENPEYAAIPVVVVSSKGLPGDIEQAVKAGASVYLTKPVSFLDMKEAVERVLA